MDPLKEYAQRATTSRRRRTTAHPWADAYLRAHGIEDAALRADILDTILARIASRSQGQTPADTGDCVMQETQDFLDETLASFVGGFAPGEEAIAGRLAYWLADGPALCPSALLDPTTAPAALRFQMRTTQIPKTPALVRGSMASRPAPSARSLPHTTPQRWLRFVLVALCLSQVTCH